jgi:hypothetical protein
MAHLGALLVAERKLTISFQNSPCDQVWCLFVFLESLSLSPNTPHALLTQIFVRSSCLATLVEFQKESTTIMKSHKIYRAWYFTGCLVALLLLAKVALAGPPLICHTIEIGNAHSLPWTNHGWNLSGNDYDVKNLVPDTLAILNSGAPILVRMETLRRATLYARQDPEAARQLLTTLVTRANNSETSGHADAVALFDEGYLIECFKQWIGRDLPHMTDNMRMDANPAAHLDGYALVQRAITLRGQDPEMEFAAALITLEEHQTDHSEHVAKAIAGAGSDPLLAQNLNTRYMGSTGITVAELFSKNTKANQ